MLRKELQEVLMGGDYDEALLPKLSYLKDCVVESSRLDPLSPGAPRVLRQDLALHTGHVLPAGSMILGMCSALNRDPKYFERPDEFYPERWSEEAKAKRAAEGNTIADHPMMMKPFSFG